MDPFQLNRPLEDGCVGQVMESKNNQFKVGDYVLGNWLVRIRDQEITQCHENKSKDCSITVIFRSIRNARGNAYVGLLSIGNLNEGKDRVFVSAASGAVGSLACQIADQRMSCGWKCWFRRKSRMVA